MDESSGEQFTAFYAVIGLWQPLVADAHGPTAAEAIPLDRMLAAV